MNILPEATRKVWKQVLETADAITAEHILRFAFVQQIQRVDSMLALEKKLNLVLPNGHKELDCLRRIGEAVLKLEGPRVESLEHVSVSDVSQKMRQLDEVDRNLAGTAIMKVINMVQEATNGHCLGDDREENLVTLCAACHRRLHSTAHRHPLDVA